MENIEGSFFSDSDQATMKETQKDCQSEVWDLFKNLSSWKEESHNQFSNIISFYDKSIKKGISDLVQEVCDLKTQLSATTKVYRDNYATITNERNVLMQKVNNLNDEIRQLNDKLLDNEIRSDQDEINEASNEFTNENVINSEDEKVNTDEVEEICQSVETNGSTGLHLNPRPYKSKYSKKSNLNHQKESSQSDGHICTECNFSFSTDMNLRIHLKNVHPKLGANGESQAESDRSMEPGLAEKQAIRTDEVANKDEVDQMCQAYKEFEMSNMHHVKSHLKGKQKEFSLLCRECNKVFKNKRSLYAHTKEKHISAHIVHFCPDCGTGFVRKSNMKAHMRANCLASKMQTQHPSGVIKPPFTYPQLITEALRSAEDSALRHSEICHYVSKKYSYYRLEDKDWQHCIGQHLSRNSKFEVAEDRSHGRKWRIKGEQCISAKSSKPGMTIKLRLQHEPSDLSKKVDNLDL